MKSYLSVLAAMLIAAGAVSAAEVYSGTFNGVKDYFIMRDGKTVMVKDGKEAPMDQDTRLLNGAELKTDGSFKISDGSHGVLQEGDVITNAGKPVLSKVNIACVKRNGKKLLKVMKDGKELPLDVDIIMSNGLLVMVDGTVYAADGTKSRLKNGEMVDTDGKRFMK